MKPIIVRMTPEQVAFGLQQSNSRCAGVLAIKIADEQIEHVRVDRNEIRLSYRGEDRRYTFATPKTLRQFIDTFDVDKEGVRPAKAFTLDPEKALRVKPMRRSGPNRLIREAGRPHAPGTGQPTSHRPPVKS